MKGVPKILSVASLATAFVALSGCPKDDDCVPGPSTYCGDDDGEYPPRECASVDPGFTGVAIPFETLSCRGSVHDTTVGADEEEIHQDWPAGDVLRSHEALDGYLELHSMAKFHDCEVDFETEIVLAVYYWSGCWDCDAIEICGVFDEGHRVRVWANYYQDHTIAADCCTHGYHLVTIGRTGEPVEFDFYGLFVDPDFDGL